MRNKLTLVLLCTCLCFWGLSCGLFTKAKTDVITKVGEVYGPDSLETGSWEIRNPLINFKATGEFSEGLLIGEWIYDLGKTTLKREWRPFKNKVLKFSICDGWAVKRKNAYSYRIYLNNGTGENIGIEITDSTEVDPGFDYDSTAYDLRRQILERENVDTKISYAFRYNTLYQIYYRTHFVVEKDGEIQKYISWIFRKGVEIITITLYGSNSSYTFQEHLIFAQFANNMIFRDKKVLPQYEEVKSESLLFVYPPEIRDQIYSE